MTSQKTLRFPPHLAYSEANWSRKGGKQKGTGTEDSLKISRQSVEPFPRYGEISKFRPQNETGHSRTWASVHANPFKGSGRTVRVSQMCIWCTYRLPGLKNRSMRTMTICEAFSPTFGNNVQPCGGKMEKDSAKWSTEFP
jgi:hypothetical protein